MPTDRLTRVPRWAAMAVLMVLVLGPLYWVTMSAFKGPRGDPPRSTPTLLPEQLTLENFTELFTATDYGTVPHEQFHVSLLTAVFTVLVAFLAAYGLYRLRMPGGEKLAGLVLVAYMIPGTLLLVPLYQAFAKLQLVNTHMARHPGQRRVHRAVLHLVAARLLFAIPREIDEAAAVDGAGPVRTMLSVVLPLIAPGLATVAVYAFVFSWTEFVFASQL